MRVQALELPEERVMSAVQAAGQRVTAADVAAAGGLSLKEAKKGVVSLAAALGAESELEVSKTGTSPLPFLKALRGV